MKVVHALPLLLIVATAGCLPTPAEPSMNQPTQQPATSEPTETERVEAGVGVGKSSQNLDQFDSGLQKAVASPAQALVRTKEKVAFEFKLKPAMDLYRATNGSYPKTEEEFMEKIVKFNRIELPELPPGHKYVYDPTDGTLYVERPKKSE